MKTLRWVGVCVALLMPASSFALGASLSLGGGAILGSEKNLKTAFELSPFYEFAILRLELPVEYQLKPVSPVISVRPGVKVFLPIVGLYARGGLGFGNLGKEGGVTKSLIVGGGWELALLDTIGVFFEATGEPGLAPAGTFTLMGRVGAMLNL